MYIVYTVQRGDPEIFSRGEGHFKTFNQNILYTVFFCGGGGCFYLYRIIEHNTVILILLVIFNE